MYLLKESAPEVKSASEITEEVDLLGQPVREKKYSIGGIFMQADRKNRNGRIYPAPVMQREVTRYMNESVRNKRAYGELNHPECHLETFQVLTPDRGYVSIRDIEVGDLVFTLNQKSFEVEIKPVREKIARQHDGLVFDVTGKHINTTVTPGHRFACRNRSGNFRFHTAQEIADNTGFLRHTSICKSGQSWNVPFSPTIELPSLSEGEVAALPSRFREKYSKPLSIDSRVFMALTGYILSEGHVGREYRHSNITITQKDHEVIKRIQSTIDGLPPEVCRTVRVSGDKTVFTVSDKRIWKYFEGQHSCYTKYIPEGLKNRSSGELYEFLDAFVLGDGRVKGAYSYATEGNVALAPQPEAWIDAFSTSERLIDDICEVALKLGLCPNKHTRLPETRRFDSTRMILAENQQPLHFCKFSHAQGIYIDQRFLKATPRHHTGMVYCIRLENETFFGQDNGQSYWSGNCPTINMPLVCILMEHLSMSGGDVIGKAKVLSTPNGMIVKALIDEGCNFGVSSRGLGSLEKARDGSLIVQDDFTLTAIDIVADPSAPDAFVDGLCENRQWVWENGIIKEVEVAKLKEEVLRAPRKELQETFVRVFDSFMSKLAKK